MSRDEALTAVLNAARALRTAYPLTDSHEAPWAVPLLARLYGAIDAVDAVGTYEITTTAVFFCAAPECWRQNDTAGMYCYQHSREASLPSLRRRAPELEVRDGG